MNSWYHMHNHNAAQYSTVLCIAQYNTVRTEHKCGQEVKAM